jgi:hypothetical protein
MSSASNETIARVRKTKELAKCIKRTLPPVFKLKHAENKEVTASLLFIGLKGIFQPFERGGETFSHSICC